MSEVAAFLDLVLTAIFAACLHTPVRRDHVAAVITRR